RVTALVASVLNASSASRTRSSGSVGGAGVLVCCAQAPPSAPNSEIEAMPNAFRARRNGTSIGSPRIQSSLGGWLGGPWLARCGANDNDSYYAAQPERRGALAGESASAGASPARSPWRWP